MKKAWVRDKLSARATERWKIPKNRQKYMNTLHSKTSLDKRRRSIMGEKHWNWQGGKTNESRRIRNSFEIKEWRKAVFARDNWTCQMCNVRGGVVLHADHIKSFAHYPELRFELANGRTLCITCHRETPTYAGHGNRAMAS